MIDTGWSYDENIKNSLPLWVIQLMGLGAELPSVEHALSSWACLYFSHLMTRIIDLAEGSPLPLAINKYDIGTLFTYHT